MAGSYNHVVLKDGALAKPNRINGMLECHSGDVVECVEEMYGMIWYLAMQLSIDLVGNPEEREVKAFIEEARENYKQGLIYSPTKRFTGE